MFKIIKLDSSENYLWVNMEKIKWHDLKNSSILQKNNFKKTILKNNSNIDASSKWINKLNFKLEMTDEINNFFEEINVTEFDFMFNLYAYEKNDFFPNHYDKFVDLEDDFLIHKYTCMIFCPYCDDNIISKGGELIFTNSENLCEIKFDFSKETNNNKFVMIVFSIDMEYKMLPILKGTKWIFKKPLFVKTKKAIKEEKNFEEWANSASCHASYLDGMGYFN